MIAMLDNPEDLDKASQEIGCPVEQIITPLGRNKAKDPNAHFCIDNGAFSGFNETAFISLLNREQPRRDLCRFVAVPDVVGSARRTLEIFKFWDRRIHTYHKLALVCQDGQEDLPIPWDRIDAVFIGGSTEWKMGKHAIHCIKAAQALGKWVHVGRVNTPGRFEYFESLGVDSIDGMGLSRYTHMRESIHRSHIEPRLPI